MVSCSVSTVVLVLLLLMMMLFVKDHRHVNKIGMHVSFSFFFKVLGRLSTDDLQLFILNLGLHEHSTPILSTKYLLRLHVVLPTLSMN